MRVTVAKTAGFCFGVRRAVELVEQAAQQEERAVTLGPIIHNRHVVEHFARMGVRPVDDPAEVEPGADTHQGHMIADGPVDGAGIHIDKTQILG